jgi:hydrogenase maturation protease
MSKKTLVLGIGNLLLGDEGVGVHAARALQREKLPREVEILEVGTAILDALPALERADRVIVLDAMKYDGDPGTIYRIPLGRCESSQCIASMHGFDIFRVLALTGCQVPPEVLVFGVEPSYIGWSMELSPQVTNALAFLLESVKKEWGRGNGEWGMGNAEGGRGKGEGRMRKGGCGMRKGEEG